MVEKFISLIPHVICTTSHASVALSIISGVPSGLRLSVNDGWSVVSEGYTGHLHH